jgi:guanylate kinase
LGREAADPIAPGSRELPTASRDLWDVALDRIASALEVKRESVGSELERRSVWPDPETGAPLAIVGVSGPGAVGKDSVCEELLRTVPGSELLRFATSRAIRANEVHGVHYTFLTERDICRAIDEDECIWHRSIPGRGVYALPRSALQPTASTRQLLVKESPIELYRISRKIADLGIAHRFILIYLLPPSPIFETLRERAAHRSSLQSSEVPSTDADTLGTRQVREFWAAYWFWRRSRCAMVVNGDLATSSASIAMRLGVASGFAHWGSR